MRRAALVVLLYRSDSAHVFITSTRVPLGTTEQSNIRAVSAVKTAVSLEEAFYTVFRESMYLAAGMSILYVADLSGVLRA
jgi:hypothetical protein